MSGQKIFIILMSFGLKSRRQKARVNGAPFRRLRLQWLVVSWSPSVRSEDEDFRRIFSISLENLPVWESADMTTGIETEKCPKCEQVKIFQKPFFFFAADCQDK